MAIVILLSSSLRKSIGIFLFSLFALAITPVSWLHNMLANHQDVCYHHFGEKGKIITKADVNCHCLSFVAEAQFTDAEHTDYNIASLSFLSSPAGFFAIHFYSQYYFYSELRGPPSLA